MSDRKPIDTLKDAYKEIHSRYDVLIKQPKLREDLNEVTLKNPRLLLSEGFSQLNDMKKGEGAE
ncbi:hypothetical protein [Bacillus sp. Marseille-P3661]|uniref:hypothetical protein n=1 Tax=Bacillus sp. Marseille-P3661 TaxID=1936234 RepID=UPI000C83663A|nr:hypothetical protein [Bacillus sp. Marseille-P3661]